jgi:predicted membrane-bound spermidine synthase
MALLLFFGLGAASVVVQAVMVRELLVVVHGTELCLGFLFASWLFWIGVGAIAGARIAARVSDPRSQIGWWVAIGALSPAVQIEIVRHAHQWLRLPPGLVMSWQHALVVAITATAAFCLMIGATFPLGCMLLEDRSGRGIGRLYMAEAAGAVAGGCAFAFLLVGRLGHHLVVELAAAVVILLAAALQGRAGRRGAIGLAALLLAAGPFVPAWDAASRARELASMMPGQRIEAVFETPYEQVAVGRMEEQFTVYGDGLAVATVPDPYETPAVVYNLLGQAPDPKSVLVLGNPATGLAGEIVRVLDGRTAAARTSVTFVHPDERQIAALATRLLPATTQMLASRVRVIIDDPRVFVRSTREAFDLVFVDAPDPTAAYVNRLYTTEFFSAAAGALSPGGVLCLRLSSASAYFGREVSDLAISVRKAMEQAFPNVVVTPGEQSYFFASPTNRKITRDPAVIDARLRALPGAAPHRVAIVLGYEPDRQRRLSELMSAGPGAMANSDHHPVSYYYGSVLWERLSSDGRSGRSWLTQGLLAVRSLGRAGAAGGVGTGVVVWALLRRALRRRVTEIDAAVAVLVAGFAAMATNLVLLIEYQSACGSLYQRLAAMSALFMLGIAVGTVVAGRRAPLCGRPASVVSGVLIGTAAFDLLLSRLLPPVGVWSPVAQQIVYAFLFCCTGTCLGAVFPASAETLLRVSSESGRDRSAARAGGIMDAMDHVGAAVGALFTGTLILPAVGTVPTLSFVACLVGTVGLARLLLLRRA